MTNAEIDLYIAKLYREAEALKERDELRKKNNDDLKKAWKKFLKKQDETGFIYACTKCDNAFWSLEKQYTETCDKCGGMLEEINMGKRGK